MTKKENLTLTVLGIKYESIGKSEIEVSWDGDAYKYKTDKNTIARLEELLVHKPSPGNLKKAVAILKMETDFVKALS